MKVAGCGGAMPDGLTVIVDAKSRAGRLVLERCLSPKGAGRERELHRRPRDRCRSYWQIASSAPVPSITSLHVRPEAAQSSWTSHRCDVALQYSTTFPLQRLPFAGQRNGTAKFPMSGQPQAGSNVNTSNAHRPFLLFTTYYPSSRDRRRCGQCDICAPRDCRALRFRARERGAVILRARGFPFTIGCRPAGRGAPASASSISCVRRGPVPRRLHPIRHPAVTATWDSGSDIRRRRDGREVLPDEGHPVGGISRVSLSRQCRSLRTGWMKRRGRRSSASRQGVPGRSV